MPRIPVTDNVVEFRGAMQPTSSGGGYSAVGEAVKGFGNALGNVAAAFDAKIKEEDDFQDKLTELNWVNAQTEQSIKQRADWTGDNPDGTALSWHGKRTESFNNDLLPKMRTEEGRKRAQLRFATTGHNFYEADLSWEYGKRSDKIFNDTHGTILNTFRGVDLADPTNVDQQIAGTLAGIDAIISKTPLPEGRRQQLAKDASDFAIAKMRETYEKAGKIDEFYPAMERMIRSRGIDPANPPRPQAVSPISAPIFDERVPSMAERQKIFQSGGVVVNLDTNWAKGDKQTTPMVVIPDGATAAQRQAAEAYAQQIAAVYKQQFGTSLEPKVLTRSENGRGRGFTIHTEPYSVNDSKAVAFFNSPEGRSAHARILSETFGKVPGVHFSIPHDPAKGDRGAHGSGGNEVDFAKALIGVMRGGGAEQPQVAGLTPKVTAYAPQGGGPLAKMEGGYAAARPGPDGQAVVRTLEDLQAGRSQYITIAGDPSQYGKTYTIPEITWIDSKGQQHTSKNVKAVVHDTGSAFKGAGDGKFDIPVARDLNNAQMNSQPFLKGGVRFVLDDGKGEQSKPSGPVRVADAGPFRLPNTIGGHAERQFLESAIKHLPQYAKEHEAAQARWAKGIEGRVKTVMDNADKGVIRDQDVAELEKLIAEKPEVAKRMGVDQAAEAVRGYTEDMRQMRLMSPTQLQGAIQSVDQSIKTAGAPPEVIASALKRKERMNTLLGTMRTALNEDPNTWADQVGIVPLTQLDFSSDEALAATMAQRIRDAKTVASYFSQTGHDMAPKFFTKAEREQFAGQLKVGGDKMLGLLGTIHRNFGPESLMAVAEISKQAPEAATVGWMMTAGHSQKTIDDAAKGIERQQRRAMGEKMVVPPPVADTRAEFVKTFGTVFTRTAQSEAAVTETVNAIYEVRAQRHGWDKPKPDEWAKIAREVVGENTDAKGTYGGVQKVNGQQIVLPVNVKNSDPWIGAGTFTQLLGALRQEDLIDPMGSGPTTASNTPLSINAVRRATPISVGNGRYMLAQGDVNDDNALLRDGTGRPFVLDLLALESKLKARRPDLYRGYEEPMTSGGVFGIGGTELPR